MSSRGEVQEAGLQEADNIIQNLRYSIRNQVLPSYGRFKETSDSTSETKIFHQILPLNRSRINGQGRS